MRTITTLLFAAFLLGCNSIDDTGVSGLPDTVNNIKLSDAMYCEKDMADYNPTAVWVTQQCPGCSGLNGFLVTDGNYQTFGSGTGMTLGSDSISVLVRPQEGVMFPGDGLSGFWFSRSMASAASSGFRIEAYANHKLVKSETFDDGFLIQGLKHPSYFGIKAGRHFDELRIVFDSGIELNDLRVFEACLDHFPTYVTL